MSYLLQEYEGIVDSNDTIRGLVKKKFEKKVAQTIIDILNNNAYTYNDFEEFFSKNSSYQEFAKNHGLDNVSKHFDMHGNNFTEEDYKTVIRKFRMLTDMKKNIAQEEIQTTTIDKEYGNLNGENGAQFIVNNNPNKSIQEQVVQAQKENKSAQTSNPQENTKTAMDYLTDSVSETTKLQYLNQINPQELNNEQSILFEIAINYQKESGKQIRIDFNNSIMVDEENTILKIVKENGKYEILGDQEQQSKQATSIKAEQKQLVKVPINN